MKTKKQDKHTEADADGLLSDESLEKVAGGAARKKAAGPSSGDVPMGPMTSGSQTAAKGGGRMGNWD